jgi:hypothetical protein
MDESQNQSNRRAEQPVVSESQILPCDHRYRTSKYFLEDQLRCSEAASDFRSVREFFNKASSFGLHTPFQFQAVPVRVDELPEQQNHR